MLTIKEMAEKLESFKDHCPVCTYGLLPQKAKVEKMRYEMNRKLELLRHIGRSIERATGSASGLGPIFSNADAAFYELNKIARFLYGSTRLSFAEKSLAFIDS